jgi:hypothetical protein
MTLLRFNAPKGTSARFKTLEDKLDTSPEVADNVLQIAKEGEDVGRAWYNTDDLHKRFVDELGPTKGDQAYREYLWHVGATSTGSKVLPNIKNASYYYTMGNQKLAEMATGTVPPKGSGYGHKMQINQSKNAQSVAQGLWGPEADPRLNPKPRGFAQSLLGNETNIAADKHFMRLMGMVSDDPNFLHPSAEISQGLADKLGDMGLGKYVNKADIKGDEGKVRINFNAKRAVKENPEAYDKIKGEASVWDDQPNDNEYAAFERVANKMAKRLDMTGPQFQASLWMGAAKRTGVDPSSLDTFMNLFDKRIAMTAKERGKTPEEVWKNFAHKKEALAIPLGLLGGGAIQGSGWLADDPSQQDLLLAPPQGRRGPST